jgi:ATP:ADP antiporter, AAA family
MLLDFVFKTDATVTIGTQGPALVRFFTLFYTGTSILAFVMQSAGSRWCLERLGLGKTVAALPVTAFGGSFAALVVPGLATIATGRAAELVVRGSLFRAGYEVCFTPISAAEKRRVKTLIDVGADRTGDAVGAGLVQICLWLFADQSTRWILVLCLVVSVIAVWMSRVLDKAYVKSLERNLMDRAAELELDGLTDLTSRSVIMHTASFSPASLAAMASAAPPRPIASTNITDDPVLQDLADLRSADTSRMHAALQRSDPTNSLLAAQIVQLLRRPDFAREARSSLRRGGKRIVGVLCDHLLDSRQDLAVRRQIPRVLASLPGRRSLHGLVLGLEDDRFEVRMQCARALLHMKGTRDDLEIPARLIYTAVDRELSAGKVIWEGHRMQSQDTNAFGQEWLDEFLKERAHGNLEYVFLLLALIYPKEPLIVAFRALHTDDRHLRGTALEYLESILPEKTRNMLWEIIEETAKPDEPRGAQHVMDDLLKASPTVVLRLKDLEKLRGS